MVKRKAEIGLDEWLKLAPALTRVEVARPAEVESEVATTPAPTTEVSSTKVETDLLTAEVTSYNEDPFRLVMAAAGAVRPRALVTGASGVRTVSDRNSRFSRQRWIGQSRG